MGDKRDGPCRGSKQLWGTALMLMIFVVVFLGSVTSVESVEGCDVSVFFGSSNKTVLPPGTLLEGSPVKVQKGSKICVDNDKGRRTVLQVTDIVVKVTYEHAYYTTDYKASLVFACSCCDKANDGECRGRGPCDERSTAKIREAEGFVKNVQVYYMCGQPPGEIYATHCILQKPAVREGPLYAVLRRTKEVGKIIFNITADDYSGVMEVTEGATSLSLSKTNTHVSDYISASVLNVSSKTSGNRSLLKVEESFYYVESAELDKPIDSMFGDFQVALNEVRELYDTRPFATYSLSRECGQANFSMNWSSKIGSFLASKIRYEKPQKVIEKHFGRLTVAALETYDSSEAFISLYR